MERLLKEGYDVICLDNFNDYYNPEIKRNNVRPFLSERNFKLVEADIRDEDALKRIFEEFQFHKVIHLAAQPGVRLSLEKPSLYMDVNVNGTVNLLELSKDHRVKSFIFGSSSSVYGATKEIPFSEEGESKPISPYGASKRAGELLCSTYNHLYGIPITALRFFTVYGPGQRPDMAIHKFTKLIDEGKEIRLYGTGKSQRDYTYVSDSIDGIISALNLNNGFDFEIFNLGNSEPTPLLRVISLIEKELNKQPKIKYLPEQPGDPTITYADISKSRKLLSYKPKVKIEEGIKKFSHWYKYEYENPKVTVLMSVYNGDKYLREAIDSILNQTFTDFEFLIVNDGSTDRTADILQSYDDPRIKIINNKKNIGLTKSLNKGLKIATGEYIARMDADDVSMPERLEKEIAFLETHRDYAVVGTFVKIVNDNSGGIQLMDRPIEDVQIREFFRRDNCIAHGSAMIRKTCLEDVGPYDESIVRAQDYDLWLRLSDKYSLANIPEYLYVWRKHNENIEAKHIVEQKIFVVLAMVKNNILDVEQATTRFIDLIVEKNLVPKFKPLTIVFLFINFITFNSIAPSTLYKVFYKIRFSKRVSTILNEFKMNKIGFEKAKLSLKEIVSRRVI